MSRSLKLINIYLGNTFEHYDTALYIYLAPFFATVFFPTHDYVTALILTFAITPIGMIARPFGSLFFGHIGDVHGRNKALFWALLGLAVVTAFIGLIPTSLQIGSYASLLLIISRVLQNFFGAGENIGGAIAFLESYGDENQKDIASSLYNSSSVVGILMASALVAVLYHFDSVANYWRWLYIGGSLTAVFGVVLRFFTPAETINEPPSRNEFTVFTDRIRTLWEMRRTVATIAIAAGFSYASYAIAFSLMNGFIPLVSNINAAEVAKTNTFLLIFDILLLPIFGFLAYRYSRGKMMLAATFSVLLTGMPLFYLLEGASITTMVLVRMVFVVIGVWFSATFHSWSQSIVPENYRYSVVSFSYSIGSQLFGGTLATLSLWTYKATGNVASASLYWILLAFVTFIAIFRLEKEKGSLRLEGSS